MKHILILSFYITLFLSCGQTKKTTQSTSKSTIEPKIESTTSDRVATTNEPKSKQTVFYGLSFKVPETWQKTLDNFEAKDLNGQVKTVETDYSLLPNKALVRLVYHPGAAGLKLYQIYAQSKRKNLEMVTINGMKALQLTEKLWRDGKGHLLKEPVLRKKYYLLDPQKKGSFEIVLDAAQNDAKTWETFHNFLNSIKPVANEK